MHCVIVGFAQNTEGVDKFIFEYENISGEPVRTKAKNINPYLVEGKDLVVTSRSKPICKIPEMSRGNSPYDGGIFIFNSQEEVDDFLTKEPKAKKFVKKLLSAREYLNNGKRWCLWLLEATKQDLNELPLVLKKVNEVYEFRINSKGSETQKYAAVPHLFRDKHYPKTFILIPRVSSENRHYIPIGFFDNNYIVGDTCMFLPEATLFQFGILTSKMHMAWVKYVCGRLKSDYRYSKDIVYNNYPFPENVSAAQKQKVETAAQAVLDSREIYTSKGKSLAHLYDPLSMPPDLKAAHDALDKSVDDCYGKTKFTSDAKRVGYLFELYDGLVKAEKSKTKK